MAFVNGIEISGDYYGFFFHLVQIMRIITNYYELGEFNILL
jgi:hypothetical protein